MTAVVNDVGCRLNPTAVAGVVTPRSLDELRAIVAAADGARPIAVCGARHSMGGQQFARRAALVDTTRLGRVIGVDDDRRLVEVEAGIRWPALIHALGSTPWSIRQRQLGADDLSVGGAVSANAHGAGLTSPPLVVDVERLVLVEPDGEVLTCSRDVHADLFRLACGGYGLFGAVYTVTLRLASRASMEVDAGLVRRDELLPRLEERIADGWLAGDVQLQIDPASRGFLDDGVLWCVRPTVDAVARDSEPSAQAGGVTQLRLAHGDKSHAFERLVAHRLGSVGAVYDSDVGCRTAPGAHWPGSSDVRTELCVPRPAVATFLAEATRELRAREADVVHASVRLVERDNETLLAWAREAWACVSVGLHVEHDAVAVGRVADTCRALIDVALGCGGSYHLAYHRWARRDQLEAAHPAIHDLVAAKRVRDPRGVFQSDWYRHLLRLLDVREAA